MSQETKEPFTLAHLAGLFALVCFVAIFAGDVGSNSGTTQDAEQKLGPKLISKAEWRQKARPFWNPGGSIKLTTAANFKALMGEPSQTQTDGDTGHAYWFYECSDGTVKIDLVDPNMTRGTLAISSISDF